MYEVIAGQRFRDAQPTVFGHPPPDLIVTDVFVGTDGKEYAHVYSEPNALDRKTLSTAILRDKRRFVHLDKAAAR